MKTNKKMISVLLAGILTSGLSYANQQLPLGLNDPIGESVNILSSIIDSSNVVYINASYWVDNQGGVYSNPFGLDEVKSNILENKHSYLIDFSTIVMQEDKNKAREFFLREFGVSFESNYVAITKHKKGIMFTELSGSDDSNITILESKPEPTPPPEELTRSKRSAPIQNQQSYIPSISIYYNASKRISDKECDINWNTFEGKKSRHLCKNANISLIYKVNMQRSLSFGSTGSPTPDSKLVRIGIDDSATGAGISLNPSIDSLYLITKGISWPNAASEAEWTSSAVARDYTFDFNLPNRKATILRTIPASNLNSNYENKEVSTFQYGIGGDIGADRTTPKVSFNASATWTESKWLTFNTKDYAVLKSSSNPSNVSFKWYRQQYATAESIQNDDAAYGMSVSKSYPGRLNLVNPISYANFTPKMEVIYSAPPETTGKSTVTINSSVGITAFRFKSAIGGLWLRFYTPRDDDNQTKRVSKAISFTVDWDNPVFTGGKPSNLQYSGFNNKCVSVESNGTLSSEPCDIRSVKQSFIYDSYNRYQNVLVKGFCLDASDSTKLSECNLSQTQKWEWNETKDNLENTFSNKKLAYSSTNGHLFFAPRDQEISDNANSKFTHNYTDIFRIAN